MAIRQSVEFASCALALCACAPVEAETPPAPRARISVDALMADAQSYVSDRYRANELPAALIADLTAEGFTCQHSATASRCGMTNHAFASCFDDNQVDISADRVSAEKNRRCLGAQAP